MSYTVYDDSEYDDDHSSKIFNQNQLTITSTEHDFDFGASNFHKINDFDRERNLGAVGVATADHGVAMGTEKADAKPMSPLVGGMGLNGCTHRRATASTGASDTDTSSDTGIAAALEEYGYPPWLPAGSDAAATGTATGTGTAPAADAAAFTSASGAFCCANNKSKEKHLPQSSYSYSSSYTSSSCSSCDSHEKEKEKDRKRRKRELRDRYEDDWDIFDGFNWGFGWFPWSNNRCRRCRWFSSSYSNMSEDEREYVVRVDVPGMKREDIKIEVDPETHVMTLSGESKESREENKDSRRGEYYCEEHNHGSFTHSYRLPEECWGRVDEIDAKYKNGVLEVHIPKAEYKAKEKKKVKMIKIN